MQKLISMLPIKGPEGNKGWYVYGDLTTPTRNKTNVKQIVSIFDTALSSLSVSQVGS